MKNCYRTTILRFLRCDIDNNRRHMHLHMPSIVFNKYNSDYSKVLTALSGCIKKRPIIITMKNIVR